MKISVIIPVYNVEQYLSMCVDHVLDQTYHNLEIILVDDGSLDKSPVICDEYANKDNRIIVIHKQNGGLSDARNAGIQVATGDYTVFLDSDDYWDSNRAIERLVDRLNITNADVLNYSYKKCYEDTGERRSQFENVSAMPIDLGEKSSQLAYLSKYSLYIASACNKIIRTELLHDLLFEKGKTSEDIEWCLRLMIRAKSFDFICENFYCYRQRAASITHTIGEKNCIDLKDNILKCIKYTSYAESEILPYVYHYIAYQLSTFVAVQAIAERCPQECIREVSEYAQLLKYHENSKKVRILYIGSRMLGFQRLCKVVRLTKKLWS